MSKIETESVRLLFPEKEKAYAVVATPGTPFQMAVVGITYPEADYSILRRPPHPINVFEYVLEGEGEILLGGVWKRVKAGDAYVLRAGEMHQYRASKKNPWKKIWINYVADYISPFLDAYGVRSGICACPEAYKYFELAMEAAKSPSPHTELSRTVADCVHKIIYRISAAGIRATGVLEQNTDEYRICEELNAALYKKLDLNALSAKLHLSKSTVIRIFKKRYGTTPYEYLIAAKIEAAKALLLNTQLPIKDIADRLCISDEHYFSTLFCSRVGLRPREFRNTAGQGAE